MEATWDTPNLRELLWLVQTHRLFSDGMDFLDLVAKKDVLTIEHNLKQLQLQRKKQKQKTLFLPKLKDFIAENYKYSVFFMNELSKKNKPCQWINRPTVTKSDLIMSLRSALHEMIKSFPKDEGSLIALPFPHVVPGGRFRSAFYWDTYFIMLGLPSDNQLSLGMVHNFAFLIQQYGYIPTGNRTYFIGRSQPPFFSYMVNLLPLHQQDQFKTAIHQEQNFWLKKRSSFSDSITTIDRKEKVYFRYGNDAPSEPRPESLPEDVATARAAIILLNNKSIESQNIKKEEVYHNIRAAAESGWDFSARWLTPLSKSQQQKEWSLGTIRTMSLLPVDLNCLLSSISANLDLFWDVTRRYYFDYDLETKTHSTLWTLAGVFPLWAKQANEEQAWWVAYHLKEKFLKKGGLLTSIYTTEQQWDAPNGWAPLQWIAIVGLRHYGFTELADEIKNRWLRTNLEVFRRTGLFYEKYNVNDPLCIATGGEYPVQTGFGWTNGVLVALLADKDKDKKKKSKILI